MADKIKREQQEMFSNMKTQMISELKSSISLLEKDILSVRAEQGKLDGLGKASESEQKRLEQQLQHSQ